MKKIKLLWKKRSFAQQLAIVFISIFLVRFLVVQGVSAFYTNHILEQKIEESFVQTLRQTGQNIDATLLSYKDLTD